MQIVYYPHPSLRFQALEVKRIDSNLRTVVRKMFDLMYEARGIGLAATQIGLPLRLFVINLEADPAAKEDEFVFINPQINKRRGSDTDEEGCLSLPKLFADVKRPEAVVIEAFDLDGQLFEMDLEELPARVVQHELDHLDGAMFTDKVIDQHRDYVDPVLKVFEQTFRQAQASGAYPNDETLINTLREIATSGGVPDSFLTANLAPPAVEIPAGLLRPRRGRNSDG
ncbi:MAG: peptide deformylase [Planctomycetaceae bacterium]|nr:peptide deformylase [Planctomycetaceae bacterium]MCA9045342.1 peptide deformylase [Planctomycetaceae bacterium]MCB9953195.1 peptide deformylase [Planctomycetaceae bacterium]